MNIYIQTKLTGPFFKNREIDHFLRLINYHKSFNKFHLITILIVAYLRAVEREIRQVEEARLKSIRQDQQTAVIETLR